MEAVGRVVGNSVVQTVQAVLGGGLSASSSGSDRQCRNVRLAGNGCELSLHARKKPVQLKSEKRTLNDAFVRPIAHRHAAVFNSSSADVQEEEGCEAAPLSPIGRGHAQGGNRGIDSLLWTGAAALIASLEVQGVMVMHAIASESESSGNSQAADAASTVVAAASRTPSWLAPAIVAFPLFSYFLFGLYRDKINPAAKVTDWLFILVAVGIVANIVLQVTLGGAVVLKCAQLYHVPRNYQGVVHRRSNEEFVQKFCSCMASALRNLLNYSLTTFWFISDSFRKH